MDRNQNPDSSKQPAPPPARTRRAEREAPASGAVVFRHLTAVLALLFHKSFVPAGSFFQ